VWPWLVQIGQTRAGFYSYEWLENLVGCDMHNADRVPEWQDLKVGDEVWLHPEAPPLKVRIIEPGRAIVLEQSWGFYLEEIDSQRTRLILRGRGEFDPDLKNPVLNFLLWRGLATRLILGWIILLSAKTARSNTMTWRMKFRPESNP